MYINGKAINPNQLTSELLAIKDSLEKKEVVVKADEKVKSSEIMEIMNSAKEAQYKKLTLAGEPLSKKEQKKLDSEDKTPEHTISQNTKNSASAKPKSQEQTSDWVE